MPIVDTGIVMEKRPRERPRKVKVDYVVHLVEPKKESVEFEGLQAVGAAIWSNGWLAPSVMQVPSSWCIMLNEEGQDTDLKEISKKSALMLA